MMFTSPIIEISSDTLICLTGSRYMFWQPDYSTSCNILLHMNMVIDTFETPTKTYTDFKTFHPYIKKFRRYTIRK